MYLMPENGQYWPKLVACVEGTKNICCVWRYKFIGL